MLQNAKLPLVGSFGVKVLEENIHWWLFQKS